MDCEAIHTCTHEQAQCHFPEILIHLRRFASVSNLATGTGQTYAICDISTHSSILSDQHATASLYDKPVQWLLYMSNSLMTSGILSVQIGKLASGQSTF